ncbi:TPA: single-stranded DNA-binding protein, partial [Clostridioides difficile]
MNNTTLIGRLTRDPELKYIPGSGTAVSTFTIAVDRDYIKKDGTKETDFIPIEVMGKLA